MSIIHSVTVTVCEILDLNIWHHVKNKLTTDVLTLVNCWSWSIEKNNTTLWWQNLTSPALWSLDPFGNFHPASCKKESFWLRQKLGTAAKLFLQLRPAKWVYLKVKESKQLTLNNLKASNLTLKTCFNVKDPSTDTKDRTLLKEILRMPLVYPRWPHNPMNPIPRGSLIKNHCSWTHATWCIEL